MQFVAGSGGVGVGVEAAPEAPATGSASIAHWKGRRRRASPTGREALARDEFRARSETEAVSQARADAAARAWDRTRLQNPRLTGNGGAIGEAAPEALVAGSGKLQLGAGGAGAGGFADATCCAQEAPATGRGERRLSAVGAGFGGGAEAALETLATGISTEARRGCRKRPPSPADCEALFRAVVRAQGEEEAARQAKAEAAAHAWDETRMQNRRLRGLEPRRLASSALNPKLRRRHLQEGRSLQAEDVWGAVRPKAAAATHTGTAVESPAGSDNVGQAEAQAASEERLPTMAGSSGGGSGPCPHGLWWGCDLCPEERAHQVEAAPETARQGAAATGQAHGQAEAAAESQVKAKAEAQAEPDGCGLDAPGPQGQPASRQWEPSECIAFAAAMAKEVAQKLCADPGRVAGAVGNFTADLEVGRGRGAPREKLARVATPTDGRRRDLVASLVVPMDGGGSTPLRRQLLSGGSCASAVGHDARGAAGAGRLVSARW